jgi:transcriptional regulator with GAF, ATPase, and Fis domain
MAGIRSVVWIGRGDEYGCGVVADAPSVDVAWVEDVEDALALPFGTFDVAVVDARSAPEALACTRRVRRLSGAPPLLVRLHPRDAAVIPDLLDAGAAEVALRPSPAAAADPEILARIEKVAGAREARARRTGRAPGTSDPLPGVVGTSAALRATFELVERAGASTATVLVSGETGTGKELLARAVHSGGARRDRSFLAVNCAAFPETLLESELFGHVRGAFTGADREKKGLFEVADGGTLFLDEVGECPAPLQAKLLRALQEREIRPVGGARTRKVDVRVIAATNRDLVREVERGRFRQDLYYRLAVFPIAVPPLRERAEDVLPLARHFLALHGRRDGKPGLRLARDTEHLLQAWSWPGNVRELENEMQRVVALAEPRETITPQRLSARLLGVLDPLVDGESAGETLRAQLERVESWLLRRALDRNGGRRAATARQLGLTREGLYKKMKRLGIG